MWAEACARLEEAERRHGISSSCCRRRRRRPCGSRPPIFWRSAAELEVTVALPGARGEEVVAQVTPSGLLIEATVSPPSFAAGVEVVRLEIPYGRMRRRIELPPGSYALLELHLDAGYLFLRLTGTTSMNENATPMTAAPAASIPEDVLIILPVTDAVLFPGVVLPIAVHGKRALAAAQEAVRTQRARRPPAAVDGGRRTRRPSSCIASARSPPSCASSPRPTAPTT